jgi:hypothetical protein
MSRDYRWARLIGSVILLIHFACNKEDIIDPSTPQGPGIDYLEIKWSTELADPIQYVTIMSPVYLHENRIVVKAEYPVSPFPDHSVLFIDTSSGEIKESWNNYSNTPGYYNTYSSQIDGNLLFLAGQGEVDCIDMRTALTNWSGPTSLGGNSIDIIENRVYKVASNQGIWERIDYADKNSGQWNSLFRFDKDDKWRPNFGGFKEVVASNGENLLLWKNASWSGILNKTEIFCYSLTHDSLKWISQDSFPVDGGFTKPVVVADLMYTLLDQEVIAVNVLTGAIEWVADLNKNRVFPTAPDGGFGNLFVNGNHIIVVTDNCPDVIVLNKDNGHQINRWTRDSEVDWAQWTSPFEHWNNKLIYTTDGRLEILDDYTGEPLLDWKRTLHLGHIDPGVAVDSATKSIYVQNGKKLFCLRIPDDLR